MEVYRMVDPKKSRTGDFIMVRGHLERINSVSVYPPLNRLPEHERTGMCPIRDDWWAVEVCTASGAIEWLGQPEFPGPR